MKRYLENSKGFTLVELMVVVAIIGILSAIAVPNFKKYQAKSKQSEAKIQLAALYSTEVAANADYDTYATCISELGYETPPKGYYLVGFTADEPTSRAIVVARNANNASSCTASNFAISPTTFLNASKVVTVLADLPALAGATAPTQFKAGAAGNISGNGTSPYKDIWTIDQDKALSNTTIGY